MLVKLTANGFLVDARTTNIFYFGLVDVSRERSVEIKLVESVLIGFGLNVIKINKPRFR